MDIIKSKRRQDIKEERRNEVGRGKRPRPSGDWNSTGIRELVAFNEA